MRGRASQLLTKRVRIPAPLAARERGLGGRSVVVVAAAEAASWVEAEI